MMNYALGPSQPQHHIECFEHQLDAQGRRHSPADTRAECVYKFQQIHEAHLGWHIVIVGHPQLVEPFTFEAAPVWKLVGCPGA